MKKVISYIIIVLILISLASCSSKKAIDNIAELNASISNNDTLKIISYNVAGAEGNYFKGNHYSSRITPFANQIKALCPDSFGTQEMTSYWSNKLLQLMPEYSSYEVLHGGETHENTAEMNSIFYLKDKYNLIDSGTFWLSTEPEKESWFDSAGGNRICSWILLENKKTKYSYLHMNTQLDNVSQEAAEFGANVILEYANKLIIKFGDIPIVLTGDFNQTLNSKTYDIMNSSIFRDSRRLTASTSMMTTYNAWNKHAQGDEPIDHIFIKEDSFRVKCFKALDRTTDKKLVSDHFGIMTELKIIK